MLRSNLSSRPFYNERLVAMIVVGATILGVLLTIFNATSLYRLSGERAKQEAEEDRSLSEAERVKQSAAKLEQSLDRSNLLMLADATREANWLIDQRTFSWTELFGVLERTMPRDARLVSVAPQVDRGVFKIVMLVNAKQLADLATLLDTLEATTSFENVLPTNQQRLEDGTLSVTIESNYVSDVIPSQKRSAKGVRP